MEESPVLRGTTRSKSLTISTRNAICSVPGALAAPMNGEPETVKNFLLKTLHLQEWEKRIDRFELGGAGAMPASFKVVWHDPVRKT